MQPSRQEHELPAVPESVWSAMVRVCDTGQRLVLERVELARGELVVIARQLARSFVLALAGGVLLIAGWFVRGWGLMNVAASALPTSWRQSGDWCAVGSPTVTPP